MENYKLSKEEKEILKSFENLKINHGADKTDNSMKEKQSPNYIFLPFSLQINV